MNQPTPYEILGLSPAASAAEIRDRHSALVREIREAGGDAARLREVETAYNALRNPLERAKVDFFLVDSQLGQQDCEAIARTLLSPEIKVEGLIQPKSVRVSHAAVMAEPKKYIVQPPPLGEAVPPLESEQDARLRTLPGPLAIEFDC
jgi:hypothetical protein